MVAIDYQALLTALKGKHPERKSLNRLLDRLDELWSEAYEKMTEYEPDLLWFDAHSSTVIFDQQTALVTDALPLSRLGRNVAVYGFSQATTMKRRSGFLKGISLNQVRESQSSNEEVRIDRGHFLAHSMGGGSDVNIFPQRRELNRGWSEQGKLYRRMERFAAENVGTFVFSRPIYDDVTWIPVQIEFGVLKGPEDFWVAKFDN